MVARPAPAPPTATRCKEVLCFAFYYTLACTNIEDASGHQLLYMGGGAETKAVTELSFAGPPPSPRPHVIGIASAAGKGGRTPPPWGGGSAVGAGNFKGHDRKKEKALCAPRPPSEYQKETLGWKSPSAPFKVLSYKPWRLTAGQARPLKPRRATGLPGPPTEEVAPGRPRAAATASRSRRLLRWRQLTLPPAPVRWPRRAEQASLRGAAAAGPGRSRGLAAAGRPSR